MYVWSTVSLHCPTLLTAQYNDLILTFPVLMIMQVLSQGPSLLLAVWTGLALLEGGESYCKYPCGKFSDTCVYTK